MGLGVLFKAFGRLWDVVFFFVSWRLGTGLFSGSHPHYIVFYESTKYHHSPAGWYTMYHHSRIYGRIYGASHYMSRQICPFISSQFFLSLKSPFGCLECEHRNLESMVNYNLISPKLELYQNWRFC